MRNRRLTLNNEHFGKKTLIISICLIYFILWLFFGLFNDNPEPLIQKSIKNALKLKKKSNNNLNNLNNDINIYDYQEVFKKSSNDKKYAYLIMHYEGTLLDNEYLLAARVLIKSLKLSKTNYEIIVMTSNCRQSSKDKLVNDGVYLVDVPPISNPYKNDEKRRTTYKAHFEYTLNKLYAWKMIRYERVIYMDVDNLVIDNMDDVVKCGHFCAEFMNQVNFHTGVLVVKPDINKFNDLVKKLSELPSYDGADQGFLTAYFHELQAAPLFDPSKGQSEDPMNRLNFGINLNHLYYYEKMSYRLQRGKSNPYSGNRGHYYSVPGKSIGYCITQIAKPWNWYPYFYFNLHWEWQYIRSFVSEDYNWYWMYFSRILGIIVTYLGSLHAFDAILNANHGSKIAKIRGFLSSTINTSIISLGRFGPIIVGFIYGSFAIAIGTPLLLSNPTVLPAIMPPTGGFTLFLIIHTLGLYWCASLFAIFTHCRMPHIFEFKWDLCIKLFTIWILQQDIYDQFINKVWMFVILGAVILCSEYLMFINMAYAVGYRHGIIIPDVGVVRCIEHQTPKVGV